MLNNKTDFMYDFCCVINLGKTPVESLPGQGDFLYFFHSTILHEAFIHKGVSKIKSDATFYQRNFHFKYKLQTSCMIKIITLNKHIRKKNELIFSRTVLSMCTDFSFNTDNYRMPRIMKTSSKKYLSVKLTCKGVKRQETGNGN